MVQALAFVLTLQQVPHALGELMVGLSQSSGTWPFLLLSIALLIVMGSVLEGAAALIIFGPLLVPIASRLGLDPLRLVVVLVIAMGIGLLAPPLGLRALRCLPDRARPDRADGEADSGLPRPPLCLPAADRLRAGPQHRAAAAAGLLRTRP